MHTEASDNAQRDPVAIPRTVTTRPNAIGFWYFRLDTVTGMLVRDGSETTASSGDDDVGPVLCRSERNGFSYASARTGDE